MGEGVGACACASACACVCVCVWTCVSLRRLRVKPQCSPPRHHRRRQLHLWLLFLVLKEAHTKCPQAPSLRTRNPTNLYGGVEFSHREMVFRSRRDACRHTPQSCGLDSWLMGFAVFVWFGFCMLGWLALYCNTRCHDCN